jgi:hypothetical protein
MHEVFLGLNLFYIFCALSYLLQIWVKPEYPRELWQVFNKLRLVNLAAISEECDLTWTLFILQSAPSLEELCIRVKCFYLLSKYFSFCMLKLDLVLSQNFQRRIKMLDS